MLFTCYTIPGLTGLTHNNIRIYRHIAQKKEDELLSDNVYSLMFGFVCSGKTIGINDKS